MESLVAPISTAFEARPYPGDENITRCAYDKRNGGTYDGPCWECQEMSEYFRGKSWTALTAKELRRYGDADALFTVKAYCYFLPAYLMAALREPKELDVCADHLWFRFGPKLDEEWCLQRLADVCDELNEAELSALLQFFRFQLGEGEDFDGYLERSIKNLEHTLSQRHSRSDE